ncbi:MAG: magnesium transporter [Pseudorhodobacter sp.]|nr:magnesium transporter [Pseudorhodobacter sp.]
MTEADDEGGLDGRRMAVILMALAKRDAATLAAELAQMHPADIADLLEQISPGGRRALLAMAAQAIDGEVLSDLDESLRDEVIAALPRAALADALRELDSDDVVDIVEDLDKPQQDMILKALDRADRLAVEQALAYPEGSAGRLMQREVVMAPEHWTVEETTAYLRESGGLPDQFYHVVLVDPRMRPTGYATLGRILSSRGEVRLRDVLEDSFRTIDATTPEEDVAYLFNQYHLISCPVVGSGGRLVGVITIDDAMAVLDDEAEEDLLRLAGVGDGWSPSDSALTTVRQRLPWLVVNLFTASISAFVISQFEATLALIISLAAVMPIVSSTGGIAGTQSLAVSVRALATRDLTSANAARVVRRELVAGVLNGLSLAVLLGMAGWLLYGDVWLGVVLGLAMITNQVVAALGGVLVPLTLERWGLDPALASGTFVTTLTDVMGYLAFLGLATWLMT